MICVSSLHVQIAQSATVAFGRETVLSSGQDFDGSDV